MSTLPIYRVVGVRADGTRHMRASNVTLGTAEAIQAAARKAGEFVRVVIENPAAGSNGSADRR
jgi:hypothetical protein